jgi:hypothetical protein
MNTTLKILLKGDGIPMSCVQGDQEECFEIVDFCTLQFELDLDQTTQITLAQTTRQPGFFYIQQVSLGAIDITKIMHYHDICRTLSRDTGQEFAKFVPDVGSPDQAVITIGPDIYSILQRYPTDLRVLRS